MGFLIFLQAVVSISLIVVVLMHSAKADGIAGIGGQANVYGNAQKEMEGGLDKVTMVLAVAFIVLAILITR